VLFCTLLPFLPGDYDSLAIPLSGMARIFGKAGLLLVPVGITSLVLSHRPPSGRPWRPGFATRPERPLHHTGAARNIW
jgi:hypothetical protein